MTDKKDGFRSAIERSNALRALTIPKEGLIGGVERLDEPLNINLSTVPEGVRIQCNRPVEDFALTPDHATALGVALIQNAVLAKVRASQASASKAGPVEIAKPS